MSADVPRPGTGRASIAVSGRLHGSGHVYPDGQAGLNRLLGVVCGGVLGILAVLINEKLGFAWGFPVLVGACVAANLLLCAAVKLPAIQGRVSCMSLLLTTLVLHGTARISYALGRLLGTLVGAVVALLVSMLFAACFGEGKDYEH